MKKVGQKIEEIFKIKKIETTSSSPTTTTTAAEASTNVLRNRKITETNNEIISNNFDKKPNGSSKTIEKKKKKRNHQKLFNNIKLYKKLQIYENIAIYISLILGLISPFISEYNPFMLWVTIFGGIYIIFHFDSWKNKGFTSNQSSNDTNNNETGQEQKALNALMNAFSQNQTLDKVAQGFQIFQQVQELFKQLSLYIISFTLSNSILNILTA